MVMLRSFAAALSIAACGAWAQSYTWTDITPPGGRVRDVGTHPMDGRIIIFGTFTAEGNAVLYTNDHGGTWNAPVIPPANYVESMFVHIGLPGVVYLQAPGRFFHAGPLGTGTVPQDARNGELYRSADFGQTWSLVRKSAVGEGIQPFASDPLDAHGVFGFARLETPCGFNPGCRFVSDIGISQTHDDGVTWSSPQAPAGYRGVGNFPYVAGPTPADPTRLFLTMPDLHVMESRDRGASWSPLVGALQPPLAAVVPDPMRANVLYGHFNAHDVSNNHFMTLRSDDAGATWREIFQSRFVAGPPVIDPLHTRTLWLGPEFVDNVGYALRRSDDGGDTWQTVSYPGGPFDLSHPVVFRGLFPSTAEPGTVYVINNNQLFRGVPTSVPDPVVMEYQYEGSRYWLTSLDGEALSQDYRMEPGNARRTGVKWGGWRADDAPVGAVGSCRFWPRAETGLRTRVLVLQGFECDILKRDPGWILEAENEFYAVPPVRGACSNGLIPVRRFNNLQPDLNHRWVVDDNTEALMVESGWYHEGVRFCSRPLRSGEQ